MVIFAICAVFLFYGLNENASHPVEVERPVISDQPLQQGAIPARRETLCFYVIGAPGDTVPGTIYRNVCTLMEDLHLNWQGSSSIHMENLNVDNSVVIFCNDTISRLTDQEKVEAYLADGGRMILAAGLSEKNVDTYLQPALGIVEKTTRFDPKEFRFLQPFLPVQEELLGYEEYTSSFWLRLQNEACVYLEDAQTQAPIIYSFPYKKGQALIFNSTILCDGRSMGLLTSGIGALLGDFLYPVIGAEVFYLDNFPLAVTADDQTSMRLCGRTTEAFIRDILWPTLQGMALRSGIPYTATVTAASTRDTLFQDVSSSLFTTMGRAALQFDMELAYAAYHDGKGDLLLHSEFLDEMKQVFPDYRITSLAALTDTGIESSIQALGGSITAVRGNLLAGDPAVRFSRNQDFSVFPCATQGTDLDHGGMLSIASVYASHGMISHKFNIHDFLGEQDGSPVWDSEKKNLESFEKRVLGEFHGLTPLSLSETGNLVKSYVNLNYAWELEDRELHLYADQFLPGQAFMLRTDREILDARNADFLHVGEHYYLVRQNAPESTLYLTEGT